MKELLRGIYLLNHTRTRWHFMFCSMKGNDMNYAIQLRVGSLVLSMFVAAPAFAQSSSQSQSPPQRVCPSGYSMLGEICIDGKTGDIVLPIDPKSIAGK